MKFVKSATEYIAETAHFDLIYSTFIIITHLVFNVYFRNHPIREQQLIGMIE